MLVQACNDRKRAGRLAHLSICDTGIASPVLFLGGYIGRYTDTVHWTKGMHRE